MPARSDISESGYRSLSIGLRSPRVAIVIPRDGLWVSHAARALWIASRTWGGSGFAVLAANAAETPDVVLRALAAYDPDHVVGLGYSYQDLWDLGVQREPSDLGPDAVATFGESPAHQTATDDLAAASSVYWEGRAETTYRQVTGIDNADDRRLRVSSPPDAEVEVALANPAKPTGLLGLIVGMREGFVTRPAVPFEAGMGEIDPGVRGWLALGLSGQPTRRSPGRLGVANPDAWSFTETDLGWITQGHSRRSRLVVSGDSVDDFALAVLWDRMHGHSSAIWIPTEVMASSEGREVVGNVLLAASMDQEGRGGALLATSATLDLNEVRTRLTECLGAARSAALSDRASITYVSADRLEFSPDHHLGCVPEDYDVRLTLPSIETSDGAVELAAQLPAHVPRSLAAALNGRPDWQVDVQGLRSRSVPAGRGFPGYRLLARNDDWTVARASRAGVSFQPMDMGLIPAGANLRQSVAEPLLRYPGLLEWTREIVAPEYTVNLSAAGQTSRMCADVVSGRAQLLGLIRDIHPLLREYARPAKADRDFPDRDGLPIPGLGSVLTFDACRRVLDKTHDDVRRLLDRLLPSGLLRRGLVLRCGYCASRDFHPVDDLAQRNKCRRCANATDITRAVWIEDTSEPVWYYSLHGAFRDLLNGNGDVPLLGAQHLAASTPHYSDVFELEFYTAQADAPVAEIDLIAVSDGELIVAEAKRDAPAVTRRSLNKLVPAASALQADTIMLMSGTSKPWPPNLVEHVQQRIQRGRFIAGRRPRLVTLSNLYGVAEQTEH